MDQLVLYYCPRQIAKNVIRLSPLMPISCLLNTYRSNICMPMSDNIVSKKLILLYHQLFQLIDFGSRFTYYVFVIFSMLTVVLEAHDLSACTISDMCCNNIFIKNTLLTLKFSSTHRMSITTHPVPVPASNRANSTILQD